MLMGHGPRQLIMRRNAVSGPRGGRRLPAAVATLALALSTVVAGAVPVRAASGDMAEQDAASAMVPAQPVTPLPVADDAEVPSPLVALGRRLFFDTRLSRDGDASCASCHDLAKGGDDGRPVAVDADGLPRQFNVPSVFNAGFAARLNWRGDFTDLEDHVASAVPAELLADWALVTERLASDADLAAAFPGGVTPQAVQEALAAYVRALVTPNAPFDRWLRGDETALTDQQKHGWTLFKSYGCAACHQGRAVGGTMFQRIGLFEPFFPRYRSNPRADLGRYTLTDDDADRHSFRVPSLRNVALTAPYLHDGSVETLEGVVRVMGYYQVGRSLSADDVDAIVAFLESLTGEVPAIAAPPATGGGHS